MAKFWGLRAVTSAYGKIRHGQPIELDEVAGEAMEARGLVSRQPLTKGKAAGPSENKMLAPLSNKEIPFELRVNRNLSDIEPAFGPIPTSKISKVKKPE